MRYVTWTLAALLLAALVAATTYISVQVGRDISAGMRPQKEEWVPPSPVKSSGRALQIAVDERLRAINARRASSSSNGARGSVVLEPVRYERGGGMVRAGGSFMDARTSGDRGMMVVLDAYDDAHRYMTSAGVRVVAVPMASTAFAVAMPDVDVFASFSVRILDSAGGEISFVTPQDVLMRERAQKGSTRMLADDPLYAADCSEVVMRLRKLGYLEDEQFPEAGPALNAIVNRFRKDHALPTMSFVDVGALLALRVETGDYQVPAKFAAGI